MKIAFASCMDPVDRPKQKIWDTVLDQQPDYLILLGDNVYMDYGGFATGNPRLGKPAEFTDVEFASALHFRYKKQAELPRFRRLVESVKAVFTTWDDHDFGWNGSHGAGPDSQGKDADENPLPIEKRKISRALHLQYRHWLNHGPYDTYPPAPPMADMLAEPDEGIEYSVDLPENLRVVMSDGRYYREQEGRGSTLFGAPQLQWLKDQVEGHAGVSLLCSGTTIQGLRKGKRDDESWIKYSDFAWFKNNIDFGRTLVLSGDVHKNGLNKADSDLGVVEAISSGVARPKGLGKGNRFGILSFANGRLDVRLYKRKSIEQGCDGGQCMLSCRIDASGRLSCS